MPAVYLMAGVLGGGAAAFASLLMGHPALLALLIYSVSGCGCIVMLAMLLAKLHRRHRQD